MVQYRYTAIPIKRVDHPNYPISIQETGRSRADGTASTSRASTEEE